MSNLYDVQDTRYEFNDPLTIIDGDWMKNSFLAPPGAFTKEERFVNTFTLAHGKFFDSSVGGHVTINPPYQYTPYADPPRKGRLNTRTDVSLTESFMDVGMGTYYSEAHDDHLQILSLEFGVPQFQSLVSFFAGAVSYKDSVVANEGRSPFWHDLGMVLGRTAVLIMYPIPSIAFTALGLMRNQLVGMGIIDRTFYSMKPTMVNYWASVNSLVTLFASERGILVPTFMPQSKSDANRLGMPMQLSQEDMVEIREYLPEIVTRRNYIDVFALALRAELRIVEQSRAEVERYKDGPIGNMGELIDSTTGALKPFGLSNTPSTYFEYWDKVMSNRTANHMYKEVKIESQKDAGPQAAGSHPDDYAKPDARGTYLMNPMQQQSNARKSFTAYYSAMVNSNFSRATFAVEYVGQSTLSATNSVKDIPLKGVINKIGGASRDVRFSFAGGNVTGIEKSFIDAGKDFIMGTLSGATFGISNVLQALLGGGNLEFPKMWDNSNVTLPQHQYKMRLGGPYGSTMAKLFDIDMPLAMLLAGVLPLSVGENSHTSPYLCRAFMRGQVDIKLGMITNLSVTKGVGNVGHDVYGRALSVDVNFTITDFSDIMTAPVHSGSIEDLLVPSNPEDPLNRYIGLLAGRSFRMSQFAAPKALLQLSRIAHRVDAIGSPARRGMWAGDSVFGRIHNLFIKDISTQNVDPKM